MRSKQPFSHWLRRPARAVPARCIRLNCERLEERDVPAVSLTGGTLNILGTPGMDVVRVVREDSQVVVRTYSEGIATPQEQSYPATSVSAITFHGGDGHDAFTNSTAIPARAYGEAGNDTLILGSGNDSGSGGAGDDVIAGGEGDDSITGSDGNDFIMAGSGNDWVNAGAGDDQVYGGEGNDNLSGWSGDDLLLGEGGDDRLEGDSGDDRIYGSEGRDYLYGDSGADVLAGGAGNDYLYGDDGSDDLYGDDGDDSLYGDDGNDQLVGGFGNDYLKGDWGNDTLYGSQGNDRLYGGSGNDRLYGGDGSDSLSASLISRTYSGSGNGPSTPSAEGGLSLAALDDVFTAARNNWLSAGVAAGTLPRVTLHVADLPGAALGWTVGHADGSAEIWIDVNAAGRGWYVDATPGDNAEFTVGENGRLMGLEGNYAASHRVDLLTVMTHEIGHTIGLAHTGYESVMMEVILPGVRYLPTAELAAAAPGAFGGMFLDPVVNLQPHDWIENLERQFGSQAFPPSQPVYSLLHQDLATNPPQGPGFVPYININTQPAPNNTGQAPDLMWLYFFLLTQSR